MSTPEIIYWSGYAFAFVFIFAIIVYDLSRDNRNFTLIEGLTITLCYPLFSWLLIAMLLVIVIVWIIREKIDKRTNNAD